MAYAVTVRPHMQLRETRRTELGEFEIAVSVALIIVWAPGLALLGGPGGIPRGQSKLRPRLKPPYYVRPRRVSSTTQQGPQDEI
jgi:hypothetical protein